MPNEQKDHRPSFDPEGLVIPRKLPNPNIESREKKDLHKEMLWKMKFGSNDPKDCELQKAYANYANRQRMKAIEVEQANRMTFEKLLEEQRQRLHSVGRVAGAATEECAPEEQPCAEELANATTLAEAAARNEFYQVFSKVRAKNAQLDAGAANNAEMAKSMEARAKAL